MPIVTYIKKNRYLYKKKESKNEFLNDNIAYSFIRSRIIFSLYLGSYNIILPKYTMILLFAKKTYEIVFSHIFTLTLNILSIYYRHQQLESDD